MDSRHTESWEEVDHGLADLASALGATQSPREAQFNAHLDQLARTGLPVPTESEALAWAEGKP